MKLWRQKQRAGTAAWAQSPGQAQQRSGLTSGGFSQAAVTPNALSSWRATTWRSKSMGRCGLTLQWASWQRASTSRLVVRQILWPSSENFAQLVTREALTLELDKSNFWRGIASCRARTACKVSTKMSKKKGAKWTFNWLNIKQNTFFCPLNWFDLVLNDPRDVLSGRRWVWGHWRLTEQPPLVPTHLRLLCLCAQWQNPTGFCAHKELTVLWPFNSIGAVMFSFPARPLGGRSARKPNQWIAVSYCLRRNWVEDLSAQWLFTCGGSKTRWARRRFETLVFFNQCCKLRGKKEENRCKDLKKTKKKTGRNFSQRVLSCLRWKWSETSVAFSKPQLWRLLPVSEGMSELDGFTSTRTVSRRSRCLFLSAVSHPSPSTHCSGSDTPLTHWNSPSGVTIASGSKQTLCRLAGRLAPPVG